MNHRKVALIFFVLGTYFFFLNFSFSLTGAVVGTKIEFSDFNFLGLIILIGSLCLFVSRQGLDAILIPTGGREADKKRTDAAYEAGKKYSSRFYLISGGVDFDKSDREKVRLKEEDESKYISQLLLNHGVKADKIELEGKATDSVENILYSFDILKRKGAKEIGIVSSPTHLDRFTDIIRQGQREGKISRDFQIYRIETPETVQEKIYGFAANLAYRYRLRDGLKNARKNKTPKFIKKIGQLVSGH
jgi:hypothetical protein